MTHGLQGTAPEQEYAGGLGIYGIGAVSRMLGLERATIRNWEGRFELVRPQRSSGGQRLFSREDVERLRFVVGLVAQGTRPAAAHRQLQEHLTQDRPLVLDESAADVRSRVLLVERDWLGADLTTSFLHTEGYEVERVFDAAQVLARYEQLRPRLAIVDLLVSGGEGLRLCRSLKDRGLPALIAISPLPTQEQARQVGADAFLSKPIDPTRLISTTRDLVGPACGPTVGTLTITRPAPKGPRPADTVRFQGLDFATR